MSNLQTVSALRRYFAWAPEWGFSLAILAVALTAALVVHAGAVRAIRNRLHGRGAFVRSFLVRTREPARLAMIVAAVGSAVRIAPVSNDLASFVQHAMLATVVLLIGWAVLMATDITAGLYMRRYRLDVSDNLLARKHLTQIRILRRAVATLVVVLTIGIALMTIPGVRRIGVSLLAAGGAAGILVGLALQPLLSNLIAGVQIALTQPIRIDDAVVIEGEYGNVEEINATYVVVRLWDLRRLVVPLKYFLDQPFQNWTRQSANLLGTVMLYLDYATPIDAVRRRFEALVRESPKWDGKVSAIQVTDARERTIEVRGLLSARNSGDLFDLRCEVREKMLGWLQRDMAAALPRDRLEFAPAHAQTPGDGLAGAPPRVQ